MKLKALFLGAIVSLSLMSFSSKSQPSDSSISDNDYTCNGGGTPCCASPGKFMG